MMIVGKFGPFRPGQTDCKVWGRVVHFDEQDGELFVWAICTQQQHENCYDEYTIVGTGQFVGNAKHYGTVVTSNGLVWHLMR